MFEGAEYAEMTTDQARERLQDLAQARYGTDRWMSAFARETGSARETINGWFYGARRPPYWALALLAENARAEAYKASLTRLAEAIEDVRRFAPREA